MKTFLVLFIAKILTQDLNFMDRLQGGLQAGGVDLDVNRRPNLDIDLDNISDESIRFSFNNRYNKTEYDIMGDDSAEIRDGVVLKRDIDMKPVSIVIEGEVERKDLHPTMDELAVKVNEDLVRLEAEIYEQDKELEREFVGMKVEVVNELKSGKVRLMEMFQEFVNAVNIQAEEMAMEVMAKVQLFDEEIVNNQSKSNSFNILREKVISYMVAVKQGLEATKKISINRKFYLDPFAERRMGTRGIKESEMNKEETMTKDGFEFEESIEKVIPKAELRPEENMDGCECVASMEEVIAKEELKIYYQNENVVHIPARRMCRHYMHGCHLPVMKFPVHCHADVIRTVTAAECPTMTTEEKSTTKTEEIPTMTTDEATIEVSIDLMRDN
eukprot:GHVP01053539.1.p1 GENE.GHVP01053539.1~~GHVP01053539.1.p1  ORF type:complete len:385 (+),score=83.13 GHVP01053539.1:107-1261(+)